MVIELGNRFFKKPFSDEMYLDYENYLKNYGASFAGFDKTCDISCVVKDKKIIELGSGLGHYSASLVELGAHSVHGVEIQSKKVLFAQENNAGCENLSFVQGDITNLAEGDHEFDLAFSHTVFEHVSDVPAALKELHRVLKTDGEVLLSFNYFHHQGGHHLFPYIYFPWPTTLVNESSLCSYWTERLHADQAQGKGFYYEKGAALKHLGQGSEFNLNRLTFEDFESMLTDANFEVVEKLPSQALGILFPFLRRIPVLKFYMTGTVFYYLKKHA